MALPSAWSDWVDATTWVEIGEAPSAWSEWVQTLTWTDSISAPSAWTPWSIVATWTDAIHIPSAWSEWEVAVLAKRRPWFYVNQDRELVPLDIFVAGLVPDPPAPPEQLMILGSSAGPPTNFTAWNNECINDGSKPGAANNGLGLHRTYSGGGIVSDFMTTSAANDVANGVASIWSCKPSLDAVANGSLDATWISFFNSIPAGHRAFIAMWHEPWDDQFHWPTYRAAQARVWNLLHNESNADTNLVSFGIIGTSWDYIQGQAQANFFPAGGEYDWCGVDMYDMYRNLNVMPPSPRGRNGHQSPQQRLGPVVSFANSVGKPWVIGELGMHPDPENLDGPANWQGVPSRPHRMKWYFDYMVDNGCIAVAWFHAYNGDDGPWWMGYMHDFDNRQSLATPDPASMAVWRDYLAMYGKDPVAPPG